jgi:surfactin synthase thioesterase subunit
VDTSKAPAYVVSPEPGDGDCVVFVPGLGGRTKFVAQWNVPGADPVIRKATWNRPLDLPPIDERGRSLAALLAGSAAPGVVLIGHSMGGLVCLEAARHLGDRLRGLVVLCQNPPHRTPFSELIDLPDRELAEQVGGVPPHVLDNEPVLGQYAALWRTEYRLLNAYLDADPRPVLDVPMVVVGALDDPSSNNRTFLEAWRKYTTGGLSVHLVPGGHQVVEDLAPETVRSWVDEVPAGR